MGDPDTGVFNAPMGGSYLFVFHIATHDNKKALLSIRLNGEEVASVFDQNHKDNPKNHYTHWVGLLLKPSTEEEDNMMKEAEEKVNAGEMILFFVKNHQKSSKFEFI